ncbi:major facilitator superfamily domain-containing protein [Mycena alexandri]|uniref:Major facilitator superfamily domain-containing protein n=1 Tax=Mycena alexandri TaxID=1745969 RepID=A0AAD6TCZ0_9AGAR|nr:major facilitator superfamily domain-containing protein [Mycena alexandri]
MFSSIIMTHPAKTPESQESRRSESLDLEAGGLDLEAQLTLNGSEPRDEKQPTHAHGPSTLVLDDSENPKNWSFIKRATINLVLCVWVLTLTYASTGYVSSLPDLIQRYNISEEVALVGVTFTVLGFAAGPLLFGPSSELYGRQVVYRVSGLFYSAFAFGAAFAPNAASLLIFRFFVGFFGAAAINNVPASIGDYTSLRERGPYSILYALMAFGGPSLGPLASAFIQHNAGYHWNFRVMAIFCTVMSILVAFLPETHGPTLLKWKNKKQGKAPPPLEFGKVIAVFRIAIARPMVYLFTEPVVMLTSIYLSILYGILYGFFEAFGVVYLEIRGFETTSYGLTYIALGLGFVFACFLMVTYGQNQYIKKEEAANAKGVPTAPEARLVLAYAGAILCPISLFLFAWTAPFPNVHWIVPCIAQFLFACSILLIATGFVPYLVDCYQMTAASALAAGLCSRALVGSIFPLFTLQMYHALTVQGATSLLAGIACLLAPIPFVFRVYGAQMRERSKHAAT